MQKIIQTSLDSFVLSPKKINEDEVLKSPQIKTNNTNTSVEINKSSMKENLCSNNLKISSPKKLDKLSGDKKDNTSYKLKASNTTKMNISQNTISIKPVTKKKQWICLNISNDRLPKTKKSPLRKSKKSISKNNLDSWCVKSPVQSKMNLNRNQVTPILQSKEKLGQIRQALDKYEKLNEYKYLDKMENISMFDESSSSIDLSQEFCLNCKDLSDDDLKEYFLANLNYIKDLKKRETFHPRLRPDSNDYNLVCSNAISAFTEHQADLLLSLLQEYVYFNEYCVDYRLKGLLPQVYLKIFMDVHSMTKDEVYKYYLKN